MKIKLLVDYRGALTDEEYYLAGSYAIPADMPKAHATALVAAGRAIETKPAVRRVSRKTVTKASQKKEPPK